MSKYLLMCLVLVSPVEAQERSTARSMVVTTQGIVATAQTLASQAGAQVLARGGSAVDAAIAANATLSVVEPMMNGMGGDLFVIYREAKTGKLYGLNASGWAPKALTVEYLKSKGITKMPELGMNSVTVPGCVDGWEKLHKRFGRLAWSELFRPAIYYAENGYPVTEIIQGHWQDGAQKLSSDGNARRLFLNEGKPPAVGEIFRNAQLANALKLVSDGGADAFYRGPVAKAILQTSDRLGGVMNAADLADFQSEWVEPVMTDYRGWKVYELPPNGQGLAVLEMLNIFERFPLAKMDAADALHVKIEAQKLAYMDLVKYVADPRTTRIPVAGLISKSYAEQRSALIRMEKASCEVKPGNAPPANGDTTYLSVVDREGNIVSLIQSIYLAFGSGVMVEGMGFHLHNRGGLFVLKDGHPNVLAGHKRPFHTIIPGYMEKGNTHIGFGIMGGYNQAQAHAQFVSNVVDAGMNIQQALEAPRFTKLTFGGCDVMVENRIPQEVRDELSKRGHQFEVRAAYSGRVGGGQAVIYDSGTNVKFGASSPRKDGAAIPQQDPYFTAPPRFVR
ncbi:MAG: gamma-glutamyltransferase [Bryobacteraceae bacterium]|nr:gamma-glutamyltransferase [Bryobacterales bacterium]NUN01936.1 gamma-glutamyltransferase [Bryobacteraceae bacterium]